MARLLWVLAIGTTLLFTSSASAQRGGGGKGKNKNRGDGFGPGMGRTDQGGDQSGFGRNRFGDQGDPSSDQGGRRGGQDGRITMTMGGDPGQMFDRMSGGRPTLNRSDLDPGRQAFFDILAKAGGVSGDTMTRQQFSAAFSRMNGGGGGPMVFSMRGDGGGGRGGFGGDINSRAENAFRRMDTDQDGLLQFEEMSDRLRENWKEYDLNKDGAISLDEFKAYMADMAAQRAENGGFGRGSLDGLPGVDGRPPAEEIRKPVVYRAGQLPKNIPDWFEELDTDRDGQVGLYEWVKGGRSVEEFQRYDRNDDGFITVEEVMADLRAQNRQPGDTTSMYASANNGQTGGRGGMGFGGPGGGRGRGGMGLGGPNGDGMGPGGGRGGRGRGGFGGPNSDTGSGGSDPSAQYWMQNMGGPGNGRRGGFGGGQNGENNGGPGRGRRGQNGDNGGGFGGGPGPRLGVGNE
jgi:Ca2+-binding EF-hand superfamily protein